MHNTTNPPVVLTLAGHDPIGGAGIQADLEAIRANGAWGASALACLTVQDTRGVYQVLPTDPALFAAQAEAVLSDLPVRVLKTGALASKEQVAVVRRLAQQHPDCALVIDPVLAGGGGGALGSSNLAEALFADLIPLATLVTPNTLEAARLTGQSDPAQAAATLIAQGAGAVLITGTHAPTEAICHRLYLADGSYEEFFNARLSSEYHGSGCTLAAAIAAGLARQLPLREACRRALAYCLKSLSHARQLGRGQALPDRLWSLESYT